MGKFVAYERGSAQDDTTTAKAITEALSKSYYAYYKVILAEAFAGFKPVKDGDEKAEANDPNWMFIGTLLLSQIEKPDWDRTKTPPNTTLRLIAEKENSYLYKWVSDNNEEFVNDLNFPVLNKLEIVDVQCYNKLTDDTVRRQIFRDGKKQQDTSDAEALSEGLTCPDLKIGFPLAFGRTTVDSVHVYKLARPLFLDTESSTQAYKYKKSRNNPLEYNAVLTWTPGSGGNIDTNKITKEGLINLDSYIINDKSGKNWRYLHHFCLALTREKLNYNHRVAKIIKDQLTRYLTDDDNDTYEFLLSKYLANNDLKTKDRVKSAADDGARLIPDNYRCFYYKDNNGEIDGFLTDVKIDIEAGRTGGYEGRADSLSEVEYRWSIAPAPNTDDFYIAKLLSYIIGLNRDFLLSDPAQPPLGFHETNFPKDSRRCARLFKYYKKIKPNLQVGGKGNNYKKNYPPSPGKPIKDPRFQKEPNEKFRKWKKGSDLAGEIWSKGERETRDNAGSVMAKALRDFQFYAQALEIAPQKSTPTSPNIAKATLNQLPATTFANSVISNDGAAKNAWNDWVRDSGDSPLDNVPTVQEWCHLYGHGDGGEEVLENFVSGSKHCNTEQLAIETGQRRISQNENIRDDFRKLLTWKITAHLIPNTGSFAKNFNLVKFIENTVDEIIKNGKKKTQWKDSHSLSNVLEPLGNAKDTFVQCLNLFSKLDKGEILQLTKKKVENFKLKQGDELGQALSDLAELIKATQSAYKQTKHPDLKTKVVVVSTFQRKLFSDYFLYCPLGKRIHYRIFFDGEKCFEHHFDAQSQSFDANEAKILDRTVEYAIYAAAQKKYEKAKESKYEPEQNCSPKKFYLGLILNYFRDRSLNPDQAALINDLNKLFGDIKNALDNLNVNGTDQQPADNQLEGLKDLVKGLERLKPKFDSQLQAVKSISKEDHDQFIKNIDTLSEKLTRLASLLDPKMQIDPRLKQQREETFEEALTAIKDGLNAPQAKRLKREASEITNMEIVEQQYNNS